MGATVKARIEVLERHQAATPALPDLSGLSHVEFEMLRSVLDLLKHRWLTAQEAEEMLRHETVFPYPIHRKASIGRPPYIRVLIGSQLVWLPWYGWPGTCPEGYSPWCHVGSDGVFHHPKVADPELPSKHRDPRWPIKRGTYRLSEAGS